MAKSAARVAFRDLGAPPNLITVARLILLPGALVAMARGARGVGLCVLLVMLTTDWLDGYVARRTGRVTELGKILDPVADKIAIDAVLVYLTLTGEFPLWALTLFVVRDLGILAGATYVARRGGRMPQSNMLGKVTLCVLGFMALVHVADVAWLETPSLVVGVVLAVASGAGYALPLVRGPRGDPTAQTMSR